LDYILTNGMSKNNKKYTFEQINVHVLHTPLGALES
jgi:hypothetical protein